MVNHRQLATISAGAYELESFNHGDVETYLTEALGTQIIAVRGTEAGGLISQGGWRDVWRDIRIAPVNTGGMGYGHAGFVKGAMGLVFHTKLVSELDKSKPIILTGHSMGGAISQVLAYYLIDQGYNVTEWVGFASPRVFKGAREWQDATLTNYCYGSDPVPQYMPPGLLYSHPVKLTKIGKPGWWPRFSDHSIANYIEAL